MGKENKSIGISTKKEVKVDKSTARDGQILSTLCCSERPDSAQLSINKRTLP